MRPVAQVETRRVTLEVEDHKAPGKTPKCMKNIKR
jgi:hypothetical protein